MKAGRYDLSGRVDRQGVENTMSRPISRIALFALIGLVLIAAAYMTVQGVFAKAESAGVQASTVGGLKTLKEQPELQSPYKSGDGGGCDHEGNLNPEDL
jgi:hypothetical protein